MIDIGKAVGSDRRAMDLRSGGGSLRCDPDGTCRLRLAPYGYKWPRLEAAD